jgi:hypothetical protein
MVPTWDSAKQARVDTPTQIPEMDNVAMLVRMAASSPSRDEFANIYTAWKNDTAANQALVIKYPFLSQDALWAATRSGGS